MAMNTAIRKNFVTPAVIGMLLALSNCAAVPVTMDSAGVDPAKWQADNDECNRFKAANPNYLGDSFKDCMERKGYKRSGA
jgi:hypothetical protein